VLVGIGFGVQNAPALVCGYVVATLFAMISFTPQGVGVVEAAVVVAFTSFGETAAAGTAIGLVYRGIVFWMPFIIGAVLINTTKAFKGDVKQAAYDQDMGAVAGTAATAARLEEEARADAERLRREEAAERGGAAAVDVQPTVPLAGSGVPFDRRETELIPEVAQPIDVLRQANAPLDEASTQQLKAAKDTPADLSGEAD